jgi:hypothetical protein
MAAENERVNSDIAGMNTKKRNAQKAETVEKVINP